MSTNTVLVLDPMWDDLLPLAPTTKGWKTFLDQKNREHRVVGNLRNVLTVREALGVVIEGHEALKPKAKQATVLAVVRRNFGLSGNHPTTQDWTDVKQTFLGDLRHYASLQELQPDEATLKGGREDLIKFLENQGRTPDKPFTPRDGSRASSQSSETGEREEPGSEMEGVEDQEGPQQPRPSSPVLNQSRDPVAKPRRERAQTHDRRSLSPAREHPRPSTRDRDHRSNPAGTARKERSARKAKPAATAPVSPPQTPPPTRDGEARTIEFSRVEASQHTDVEMTSDGLDHEGGVDQHVNEESARVIAELRRDVETLAAQQVNLMNKQVDISAGLLTVGKGFEKITGKLKNLAEADLRAQTKVPPVDEREQVWIANAKKKIENIVVLVREITPGH